MEARVAGIAAKAQDPGRTAARRRCDMRRPSLERRDQAEGGWREGAAAVGIGQAIAA
jgi:hypothetical protein